MSRGPRRLLALAAAGLALVVAASLAHLLLPPGQSRDVPQPAPDATPEQVVRAYLDALDAHDCETAEALTTRESRAGASSWCGDVASLRDISVRHHVSEDPRWSGHPASQKVEVANVSVSFDLDWRLFHDDGTIPEGATPWGYLLERESPGSPWRIFDQGVG